MSEKNSVGRLALKINSARTLGRKPPHDLMNHNVFDNG